MPHGLDQLLEQARIISVDDCESIQEILERNNKSMWVHFSPFLVSYCLPPRRSLYLLEIEGSLVLIQVNVRNGETRTDLLFPPVPYTDKINSWLTTLPEAVGQEDVRIIWVDEEEISRLRLEFDENLAWDEKGVEYIYEPEKVWTMEGSEFRDMRKRVRKAEKNFPDFMDLSVDDIFECQELLRKCLSLQ